MNVTVATEFVRNMFKLSHDELSNVVEKTPPGSDGLILLPYFEGERTPNIPDGTGLFYGLNSETFNMQHFGRASMEGVTLGMNYGLNRMKSLGIEPSQIRLTGGGSKNAAWRQISADVFNAEVVCLETDEGAAYGAALQAIWTYKNGIGERTSIQELTDRYVRVDEETLAHPISANVEVYRELQKIQDNVSLVLRKTFTKHRKFLTRHVA
jgi:sugar (pentulose or hexulose) kinase